MNRVKHFWQKWSKLVECNMWDRRDNMSQTGSSSNRQVQRTRSWIFEALMILLEEKPYSKIGVSDITKKAGIARQTFYRNYSDKDDIVSEKLMNTISLELLEADGKKGRQGSPLDSVLLTFNFSYMMENKENIKKMLSIIDIEHRIRNEGKEFPLVMLEQYRDRFEEAEYLICRYKLYYQLIGCLQVFFDWFMNDMPMPVEKVVSMLNEMNIPRTIHYRNFPNITVRIE